MENAKPYCRKYQTSDLEVLQALMRELGYSVDSKTLQNNIKEICKNRGEILIAGIGREVVGSVCVLIDARLAEGVYAEIVSLIVSAQFRGAGIGKALVRAAEIWASTRVDKVRVRANSTRLNAHLFYNSQGYDEVKTQKVFVKMV
jgi:ribosomal protein S18 acetylase RimI-like enzyme